MTHQSILAVSFFLLGALVSCGEPAARQAKPAADPSTSASGSPDTEEGSATSGFRPESESEQGMTVMPVTFVDGSRGEIVADGDLGIDEMTAQIFTAGGLGGVDRTINFAHGEAGAMMYEGPLETYEGIDGSTVEVWGPAPDTYLCPNLVYRFGDWFVGVRTCQPELSTSEKEQWARLLLGRITEDGFLVLSATRPLELQQTGGHEGPEMIIGSGRADWIELEPGECNAADVPDEGDTRTMPDGTKVSFSRIEDGNSNIDYDWFAT